MNQRTISLSRDITLFQITLFLFAVLALLVSLHPEWHVWGLDSLKAYPIWLRVVLVLLMGVLLVPGISKSAGSAVGNSVDRLDRTQGRNIWIVIVLLLLVCMYVFKSANFLLGDGYSMIDRTAAGSDFSYFQKLDLYLHRGIFKLLSSTPESNAIWSYRITSFLAGGIVLFGLFIFIKEASTLLITLSALLTLGVCQAFFGYIEHYPLAFALMILFLLSSLRDYEQRKLSPTTIVLFFLALGFHFALGMMLPLLLFLFYRGHGTARVRYVLWGLAVAALAAAVYFVSASERLDDVFVALTASNLNPYTILSSDHLLDMLEIILLSFSILIPLLWMKSFWDKESAWLKFFCIAPPLLFTFVVDPKLTAIRDWDLLSFAAMPTLVLFLVWAKQALASDKETVNRLILPMLLFGFLHTGSHIYQNTQSQESWDYIKKVVGSDVRYSAKYHHAELNITWAILAEQKYHDYEESMRAKIVRLDAMPSDSLTRYNLGMEYASRNHDPQKAATLFAGHWQEVLQYPNYIADYQLVFAAARMYDEMEAMCEAFVKSGQVNGQIYFNYAVLEEVRGDTLNAWRLYETALTDPLTLLPEKRLDICLYASRHGHGSEVVEELRSLIPLLPNKAKPSATSLMAAIPRASQQELDSLCDALAKSMK